MYSARPRRPRRQRPVVPAGWTRSRPSRDRPPTRSPSPRAADAMASREYGQYCGITRALELVGERWALLIVRDLLVGPRRYGELQRGLPRIPSNILASRLKELQEAGIIRRIPRVRQIVYELTPYGRELEDVVLALGRFGFKAMGDPRDEQVVTARRVDHDLPHGVPTGDRGRAAVRPATPRSSVPAALRLAVTGSRLQVVRLDEAPADLRFETGPGIRRAHLRRTDPRQTRSRMPRCGSSTARRTCWSGSREPSIWPPERPLPLSGRRQSTRQQAGGEQTGEHADQFRDRDADPHAEGEPARAGGVPPRPGPG